MDDFIGINIKCIDAGWSSIDMWYFHQQLMSYKETLTTNINVDYQHWYEK